jgi:hypothetical protein
MLLGNIFTHYKEKQKKHILLNFDIEEKEETVVNTSSIAF